MTLLHRSLLLSFVLCAVFVSTQVRSQAHLTFSPAERRIITMVDERRGVDSLVQYLKSPDIKVAWRAAIGLGNIGDTNARLGLRKALEAEQRDTISDAEAWALGMLGADQVTWNSLMGSAMFHPSEQKLIAIARTATPELAVSIAKLADKSTASPLAIAKAFTELAVRKLGDVPRAMDYVETLALNNNPEVRWRSAFVFSRIGDSLDLTSRLDHLRDLLNDQGTPYSRMFAALALGRIHDPLTDTLLSRAYRSENDWRVRVNILTAFQRFPKLDSIIFSTIHIATVSADVADPASEHVALTALATLQHFVESGTFTKKDSDDVSTWLSHLTPGQAELPSLPSSVAAFAATSAARLRIKMVREWLRDSEQEGNPYVSAMGIRAAGLMADSAIFKDILLSVPVVQPLQQMSRYEALDSIWQASKRIPALRAALDRDYGGNAYRQVLIRTSEVETDPAIVVTSLEHLRDTSILNTPALHATADSFALRYMEKFSEPKYRDQYLAAIETIKWLQDRTPAAKTLLLAAYDSGWSRSDRELMDSARIALQLAGANTSNLRKYKAPVSHIDWGLLESMPDNMIINFNRGSIELKLLPYYAPLTTLNMVRLSKIQYFANEMIHRVVPNFVVQAGDPTNTGWGGPGYSIRTELSPLEYDAEGLVGMASSGKDTEGSQWFITESPTPHLTDHYTIWAKVADGMQEVFNARQGDKYENIVSYKR